jgi:hypothetical protein
MLDAVRVLTGPGDVQIAGPNLPRVVGCAGDHCCGIARHLRTRKPVEEAADRPTGHVGGPVRHVSHCVQSPSSVNQH